MDHSVKTGIAFGLTSGVITTLGLMVGLHSGTHSDMVVLGGVMTIAIADAFSDALGIHISEESENVHTAKEIWTSTIVTFFAKFFCAISFLIPLFLFDLPNAIRASVAWGAILMTAMSWQIARSQNRRALPIILEHLAVMALVITATHSLGKWISGWAN